MSKENKLNVYTYDKNGKPMDLKDVYVPEDLARQILKIFRKELI